MWTKFTDALKATAGAMAALAGFVVIAILGLIAFFVFSFLFWGIIAIAVIVLIWFLIWSWIQESREHG